MTPLPSVALVGSGEMVEALATLVGASGAHRVEQGADVELWVTPIQELRALVRSRAPGPADRIVRLFEYESLDKWREWTAWLNGTPEGKDLLSQLHRFNIVVQPCLLAPAPNSDRIEL